jgi:hypothetical protein
MAELVATRAASIGVHASPEALDDLTVDGSVLLRPAPDEAMLLAPPGEAPRVLETASAMLAEKDPTALVLDESDGWSIWTLVGEDARAAFARISALSPPAAGATQGEVAHLPARVVVIPGAIHVVVASMWSDALRDLIVEACPEVRHGIGAASFEVGAAP